MDLSLRTDLLESFDVDLQSFYREVLAQEEAEPSRIRHALREVTNAYRRETVDALASDIRFDTPAKRSAYVLKHCACFASAVAKHLHRWLRRDNVPQVLRHAITTRRRIELCCLGGGPATDAVGVARMVHALDGAVRTSKRLLLRVRVVDMSGEWLSTADHVTRVLSERLCPGMIVEFEFLRADLTGTWEAWLREAVGVADVVTAVYFVSAVNGSRARNKCLRMLQDVMGSMKTGALLFFLDSSKSVHLDTVMEAASSFDDMGVAYGPRPQSFQALSLASVERFLELHGAPFGSTPPCLTHCFVACCGWVKGRSNHSVTPSIVRDGRRWRKWVRRNTKKAERYRESVERLLLSRMGVAFEADDDESLELGRGWEGLLKASKSKQKRIRAEWS